MDPYTFTKLGNVSIERVPVKSSGTKNEKEEHVVETPLPEPTAPSPLLKLPSSIDVTVTSTNNVTPDLAQGKAQRQNYEQKHEEENTDDDYNSDLDEKSEPVPQTNLGSEDENVDELCNSRTSILDDAQDDIVDEDLSSQSEKSPKDIDSIYFSNSTNMALDEMSESIDVLERLPEVESELDDSEFREVNEPGNELPDVPPDVLIKSELPEAEMVCKKEEVSHNEKSVSDDADDESDNNKQSTEKVTKKKRRKPKTGGESKESKKQKVQDGTSNSEEKEKEKSAELKGGNLRRNIREVMDETKLDEATVAAQMQEKERLRRVQEQLKANRDIQRQFRVISRFEKGIGATVKKEERDQFDVDKQKSNKVVVTLNTGSSTKHMLDMLKGRSSPSASASDDEDDDLDNKFANFSKHLDKPLMMTSSVSIAPVNKETHKLETVSPSPKLEEDDSQDARKDVVMISSDSDEGKGEMVEDDDDDCIVISEEDESEPEEDAANSGMHTNDEYNIPDAQGRVLINVGHADSEKDVFLAPQIARIIKPHQIGGVRFLFDNIVESLDRYNVSEGFGCILAHSMGLGKTLQVISFSDIFLRHTPGRTILCIMPINTLQNWVAEFNMWLPVEPETSSLKEQGEVLGRQFPVFVLNDNQKTLTARSKVISLWYSEGGVLLIGYELYRQLCLKRRTRSKRKSVDPEDDIGDEKSKALLDSMYHSLVKPGPDLVICDEGHRIKNSHASVSQALKQIRSKRRVVLTGYPLQNNLLEYWCMVDFVRPNYLGTKTEFSNMFERPIQNGQCIDSTPEDIKLMRFRAHVLHSLLEGFVQRRSHAVLQQTLPSKQEFVLLLRFTSFQQQLYTTFMNEVVRIKAVPNPLKAFAVCCKIWNHPDILYNFLKKRAGEEDIDLDLDDTATSLSTSVSGPSTPMTPSTPPQQISGKRNRIRTPKGSQSKEAKVARKNSRTSTPQPITKTASMAAVPPYTASKSKPLPPEQAITTSNNQSIPTFNSYNNNGTQNYSQTGNEGRSANYNSQSSNSSESFTSQYSQQRQQDYDEPSSSSSNANYSNVNYRQNYGSEDSDYYQSEYQRNNYWPRNNESNNSNSYNAAPTSNGDYYPNASQSYGASEYSGHSASEPTRGAYDNTNYNFDTNSQRYWSGGNFSLKHEMSSPQQTYSDASLNRMDDGNTSYSDFVGSNANPNMRQQFGGRATTSQHMPRGRNGPTFDNAFHTPPARTRGRPPLTQQQQRARAASINPAGRRRDTDAQEPNLVALKPGLPGGAPIPKSKEQKFNMENESNARENKYTNSMLSNSSFPVDVSNDELWASNQSNVLSQQDYLYRGNPLQGQPLMPNNSSAGVPGPMLTEETFNQSRQSGYPNDPTLLPDNYNIYSDDSQGPSATSFMRLLQDDDSVDLHQSRGAITASMNLSSLPVQKDVSESIQGLARSGHITLKMVDNKKSHEEANIEGNVNNDYNEGNAPSCSSKPSQIKWDENLSRDKTSKDDLMNRFGPNISLINVSERMEVNEKKALPEQRQSKVDSAFSVRRLIDDRKPQSVGRSPLTPGTAKPDPENPRIEVEHSSNDPRTTATFTKPMAQAGNYSRTDTGLDEAESEPATEMYVTKGGGKDIEPGIPYEWANEFFKDYEPGKLEASAKTLVFFCMLDEIIKLGDRILLFSQSLFTLDLIEDFLHLYNIPNSEDKWARNKSYFRLDGSTSALEREKLINEFNANPNVHLFLVSTRAGSLGINLVGANRVIVFDASWNPCHDTQAVCRVYRYGQQKACYVYRFVMDNCLEKKIYDRQINKQGISDRIVDECNPDAHLTTKDVSNLCWDTEEVSNVKIDFKDCIEKYNDPIIRKVIENFGSSLSKEPFIHESLLVDRKDTKLSQAEKRMAKRGYELEKQASSRPTYGNMYGNHHMMGKPMASVRPMVADSVREPTVRRWIPAEVWQKQGMSAQEMTLPLDVVIPTSTSDSRSSIVLKTGQKVMVLKSPKGIYMQLENGKIVAIKTPPYGDLNTESDEQPPPAVASVSRLNSLANLQGRTVGPGIKVQPAPGLDHSALGSRRVADVSMSPIRNRFPRPNMSGHGTQAGLGQGAYGMFRPQPHLLQRGGGDMYRPGGGQPGPRPFPPLMRPQANRPIGLQPMLHRPHHQLPSSSSSSPGTHTGNPIFGPNSAVTISVANRKNVEMDTTVRPKEFNKVGTSRPIEVSYDDYKGFHRAGDHPRSSTSSQYSDSLSDLHPSRNVQFSGRPNVYAGSRDTRAGAQKSPPAYVPHKPGLSKMITESLRFKKDIDFTPVVKQTSAVRLSSNDRAKMTPLSYYHQQPPQPQ